MIAFGAACWAVGDILLRCFLGKKVVLPTTAHHTLAFTTGNVAFSYLLTILGFIGAFVPTIFWILFFTGIGITIWQIIGELRRSFELRVVNQTIQENMEKGIAKGEMKEKTTYIFLMLILGLFFLPAILQAAAPPYVRDSLVYHLLCPKEYLRVGRLVHIDGNIFSAFPKGHEVLMTLLLGVAGDRAAQGFSILQQMAAIGGLYSLVRLMAGPWPSAVCTIGYATIPPLMYFTGCGYVEPALLMVLGNCLLAKACLYQSNINKSENKEIRVGSMAFIGFLAGWMISLKYNGLIYLGLIGLILLWGQRKKPTKKFLSISGAFTLAAAPGLCWMGWNWMTLSNPVYPMAWFLFGGTGWDEVRAFAMSAYFDIFGMGRSLSDYLLLPWRVSFLGKFDSVLFDGAIGPFLLLFLALAAVTGYLLISHRRTEGMTKQIGFMFVVSTVFFVLGTQQVRFWLPSQMLACAFVAPVIGLLVDSTRSRRMLKLALVLTVIASLAWNMWFLGKQFLAVGYYRPVLGMEQEKDFLIRKVPGYPALEFINGNLPEHSRTLCVWTGAYGYYIDRPYYSDTFIEDVTLKRLINESANGKELSQRLIGAGFTHLFFKLSMLEKNMEPDQRVVFNDFLRKGAFELYHYQGFSVFAIQIL